MQEAIQRASASSRIADQVGSRLYSDGSGSALAAAPEWFLAKKRQEVPLAVPDHLESVRGAIEVPVEDGRHDLPFTARRTAPERDLLSKDAVTACFRKTP